MFYLEVSFVNMVFNVITQTVYVMEVSNRLSIVCVFTVFCINLKEIKLIRSTRKLSFCYEICQLNKHLCFVIKSDLLTAVGRGERPLLSYTSYVCLVFASVTQLHHTGAA